MRKIIYTLLFLLSFAGINAQQTEITGFEAAPTPDLYQAASKTAMTVDTIDDYLARATAFYTLTAGTGYVLGSNSGINETALHYDGLGSTIVSEVIAFFAHKEVMGGTADSMEIAFYAAGPDSFPMGAAIGTGKFSVDDADTSGFGTFIPINSTGPALGDFIVSLRHDLATYDDTLVLISSNPLSMGGGPDGNGERRTRQLTAGGWFAAADVWTIAGNPFDADALLVPIVDFTAVGVDQYVGAGGFRLYDAYPNPAQVDVRIPYEIDAAMPVQLSIVDARGAVIMKSAVTEKGAGRHEFNVKTSELAAGNYYYLLQAGGNVLGGKFFRAK